MGFDEEDNVETTEKLKQIEEELGVAGNFVGNKVKVGESEESGDKNEERTDGSGDKNGQQKEDTAGASGGNKEEEVSAFENEDSGVEEESNEDDLFDEDDTVPIPDLEPVRENDDTDQDQEWEGDDDSSDSPYNSNEDRMALSSCDEVDDEYKEFNEATDMEDPQFRMGMLFSNAQVFRAVVRMHAIKHQRGIRLKKNLSDKVKWICVPGCDWKCYARKQQRSSAFQIKTICAKHTCNPVWEQKQVTASWLAEQYEEEIRMNPTWPVESFQLKAVNDFEVPCK